MSLPAMSLGLRFYTSRKGGTGGGGRVSTLSPGNMAASELTVAVESHWSALGRPFLPSFARNVRLFACTVGATIRHYCKLVTQWVWFES